MSSDLREAGLIAVFDHTDEVCGSGRNKLWPERPHDWIQQQGTVGENSLIFAVEKKFPVFHHNKKNSWNVSRGAMDSVSSAVYKNVK